MTGHSPEQGTSVGHAFSRCVSCSLTLACHTWLVLEELEVVAVMWSDGTYFHSEAWLNCNPLHSVCGQTMELSELQDADCAEVVLEVIVCSRIGNDI